MNYSLIDIDITLKKIVGGACRVITYKCRELLFIRTLRLSSLKQVGPVSTMGDSYIIAIDFGTAYSGYAYSVTTKDKKADPIVKQWGKEFGPETSKTPTCILFNEDEEFLKFGYEAQTVYANKRGEDAKVHLFFDDFKMALYNTVSIDFFTVITLKGVLSFVNMTQLCCKTNKREVSC